MLYINNDVGKCKSENCIRKEECYRHMEVYASEYDFYKICNEENNYKWFLHNCINKKK